MELTVLGKSPAWQDDDGACSGYLVTVDGFTLLLDCGNGVFGKLRSRMDPLAVDAVLLSHLHPDHFMDLIPYSFALGFSGRRDPDHPARPALHVPPGGRELLRGLMGIWDNEGQLEERFRLSEYDAARKLEIGPLTVRFAEVPHYVRSWACDLSDGSGRRLTFGADCGPNEALVALAQGTDLLLAESTLAEPEPGERGHMTAGEAGDIGRRAGARRLVLTHFSDELDRTAMASESATAYGSEVELAAAGALYTI